MPIRTTATLLALALGALIPTAAQAGETLMWFEKPATDWMNEGTPLGNGRMGLVVFGAVSPDRIHFNEASLWTGDANPSGKYEYKQGVDKPDMFGCFQSFGNVWVDFTGLSDSPMTESPAPVAGTKFNQGSKKLKGKGAGAPADYRRELDLATGEATVTFTASGVKHTRRYLCSRPGEVGAISYTSDKPGALSGVIYLVDDHGNPTSGTDAHLVSSGKFANGLVFQSRVAARAKGGSVKVTGTKITFEKCDTLEVFLGARTNYVMDAAKNFTGEAPGPRLTAELTAAATKGYDALRTEAVAAHAALFDRVAVEFGNPAPEVAALSTHARHERVKTGKPDPGMDELMYQFGRYLMIGSARPGGLPANLQGVWNDSNVPRWASDYHNNINIQMNYWGAEAANLGEQQRSLIDFVEAMVEPCRAAVRADTKKFGADVKGWTCRTSQNARGGNGWEWNIPASAWYMQHVWEHYDFNRDRAYLEKTAYPMMKEVCAFWEHHLKELSADGANFASDDKKADRSALKGIKAGTLVAPHGWSPEHGPKEDGIAHDQQIIWDLFNNTAEAAGILGDTAYAKKIAGLRDRLAGPRIGKWGQLQEWMIDRDQPNDTHRHTSQLFALFPGRQISMSKTPELAKAALVSLKSRSNDKGDKPFTPETTIGDSRRSWTWSWRAGMWARLHQGDRAHTMLQGLLTFNTLDNLWAVHPPFQIDGNLGILGGINETLLQSHAGEVELLPCVPSLWKDGSAKGLRARGGFTVAMDWKGGKLVTADITSDAGSPLRLRAGAVTVTKGGAPVPVKTEADGVLSWPTEKGATYRITAK